MQQATHYSAVGNTNWYSLHAVTAAGLLPNRQDHCHRQAWQATCRMRTPASSSTRRGSQQRRSSSRWSPSSSAVAAGAGKGRHHRSVYRWHAQCSRGALAAAPKAAAVYLRSTAAGAHLMLRTSGPGAPRPTSPSCTGCRPLHVGNSTTAVGSSTLEFFAVHAVRHQMAASRGRHQNTGRETHLIAPQRGPSPPTPAPSPPVGSAAEGPPHAAGRAPAPAAPACCCQRRRGRRPG